MFWALNWTALTSSRPFSSLPVRPTVRGENRPLGSAVVDEIQDSGGTDREVAAEDPGVRLQHQSSSRPQAWER